MTTTCAWCYPDHHVGSHGICQKHAAEVLQQHRERKTARTQRSDELKHQQPPRPEVRA